MKKDKLLLLIIFILIGIITILTALLLEKNKPQLTQENIAIPQINKEEQNELEINQDKINDEIKEIDTKTDEGPINTTTKETFNS